MKLVTQIGLRSSAAPRLPPLSSATAPVAFAMLLLPRLAQACPMCANQQPGGMARTIALGVMMMLPFTIAFVLFGALRRAGGSTTGKESRTRVATDPGGEPAGDVREPNL